MSAGSISSPKKPRALRREEQLVLRALLEAARLNSPITTDDELCVEDMEDGGMGSLRFALPADRHKPFGRVVAEAEYVDEDGVPVSITLNTDQDGNILELDFWKIDFSPLKRYPRPADLKIKHEP